ncbi:hypothetical protein FA95DRAFT_1566955 [Auriscalpium vulgare]|uniref:Uncharacterized protein n=2 Tax=Auriscalpium vulgare TaxID=40419 RepID=A0ACB8R6W2_9AGAM|nr:hypothetical protein FA95DRAFT_1566954 [Auriscalpium vulgare]KAI0039739.1 hypothetical protein FA95DRAFT_1566955 [Auriscalpium vulgare]
MHDGVARWSERQQGVQATILYRSGRVNSWRSGGMGRNVGSSGGSSAIEGATTAGQMKARLRSLMLQDGRRDNESCRQQHRTVWMVGGAGVMVKR